MLRTIALIAAGALLASCNCMQTWSTQRRREKQQIKKVDLPRWEDEGGAPHPDKRVDTPQPSPF